MQVDIDVTCMYTNFGGCVFFGFGDILASKHVALTDYKYFSFVVINCFVLLSLIVTCLRLWAEL